jgi:antitoxin component YwqK of YwqJK toxin-antitoxin module
MNEVLFQNGKKQGAHKVYINSGMADIYGKQNVGKVLSVTNYSSDAVDGLDQMFSYNGAKQILILQKVWAKGNSIKEEAWYDDGKPKSVQVLNGLSTTWYPTGKKQQEVMMKDGSENGKVSEWYENGNLYFVGQFQNGQPVGDATVYFENGSVRRKITYDQSTAINTTENYTTGKVKWIKETSDLKHYSVTYFDSLKGYKQSLARYIDTGNSNMALDGIQIEYEEDGSIISEEKYENGKGIGQVLVKEESGGIVLQGEFRNGKKAGEWIYYLKEDGSKTNKIKSAFKMRKVDYRAGSTPYKYVDYYLTGEKQAEGFLLEEWPDKNIQFYKAYFKNGQVAEEGSYTYNSMRGVYEGRSGQWKFYHENGALKANGRYILNEQAGPWEYFDENGTLTERKNF